MSAAREKARRLVALAVDESTTREERASAALRAAKIIARNDLLASPLDGILDGNETVQAAKTLFGAFMDPKVAASAKTIADKVRRARRR